MLFNKKNVVSAFKVSVPVLMGYTTMGAAFGILMVTDTSFGPLWVLLLSVTQESGSLQFAAVGMMKQLMPLMETALMSLLINIRYSVYGLSLIEPFKKCGIKRFYMIGALTDETYALLVQDERPEDVERGDFMFLVALFNHLAVGLGLRQCAGAHSDHQHRRQQQRNRLHMLLHGIFLSSI